MEQKSVTLNDIDFIEVILDDLQYNYTEHSERGYGQVSCLDLTFYIKDEICTSYSEYPVQHLKDNFTSIVMANAWTDMKRGHGHDLVSCRVSSVCMYGENGHEIDVAGFTLPHFILIK